MTTADRFARANARVAAPVGDGGGGPHDTRRRDAAEPRETSAGRHAPDPEGGLGASRGILVGLGVVTPFWVATLAWLVSCQIDGRDDCGEMAGADAGDQRIAATESDRAGC